MTGVAPNDRPAYCMGVDGAVGGWCQRRWRAHVWGNGGRPLSMNVNEQRQWCHWYGVTLYGVSRMYGSTMLTMVMTTMVQRMVVTTTMVMATLRMASDDDEDGGWWVMGVDGAMYGDGVEAMVDGGCDDGRRWASRVRPVCLSGLFRTCHRRRRFSRSYDRYRRRLRVLRRRAVQVPDDDDDDDVRSCPQGIWVTSG